MKKLETYQIWLNLFLLAGIMISSPLLMAFAPYSFGQIPVPPSWILEILEIIGKWVIQNIPLVVEIAGNLLEWILHFTGFTNCGVGQIMVDPNNPLNGIYNGCLECFKNGEHHKIYNALMVRPSINAPFDLAPSVKNYCP